MKTEKWVLILIKSSSEGRGNKTDDVFNPGVKKIEESCSNNSSLPILYWNQNVKLKIITHFNVRFKYYRHPRC